MAKSGFEINSTDVYEMGLEPARAASGNSKAIAKGTFFVDSASYTAKESHNFAAAYSTYGGYPDFSKYAGGGETNVSYAGYHPRLISAAGIQSSYNNSTGFCKTYTSATTFYAARINSTQIGFWNSSGEVIETYTPAIGFAPHILLFIMAGGGGGGGGSYNIDYGDAGGGGGVAIGYVKLPTTTVWSDGIRFIVGAGGAAGRRSTGGAGGASSVYYSGYHVTCNGGGGGQYPGDSGSPGSGGTVTSNQLAGTLGLIASKSGGSGGFDGVPCTITATFDVNTYSNTGAGGSTPGNPSGGGGSFGPGGNGGYSSYPSGKDGTYGGGGGGATNVVFNTYSGGVGGTGILMLQY